MKSALRSWVLPLIPVIAVGMVGGWFYSSSVVGHPHSSPGYFGDTSALDSLGGLLQDTFSALQGGVIAAAVFVVVRLVAARFTKLETWVGMALSIFLVGGNYARLIAADRYERELKAKKNIVRFQREKAVEAKEQADCKKAIANVGWVQYPNLRGGFDVSGCTASMTPTDDAYTVIRYYLSRAESWQEEPSGVHCIVRSGDYRFYVTLSKTTGPATIYTQVPTRQFAHQGPGTWPPTESPATTTMPNVELGVAMYPGSRLEQSGDKIRMWTKDDVASICRYYQSVGATGTSINRDKLDETQTFQMKLGRRTAYIAIMAGTGNDPSTLIEILLH